MSAQKKTWKEIPIAGVCMKPSTDYKTGDWRTFKPVVDYEKCTNCLICWIQCPDSSIDWTGHKVVVNYDYCKGCGICSNECPVNAIEMVLE